MQEALEIVCRRRKLLNPNDYALLLGDMSVLIPLDRTVQSLEGQKDLVLIKRSMLPQLRLDLVRVVERTTDPNGSCFLNLCLLIFLNLRFDHLFAFFSVNFQADIRCPSRSAQSAP